VKSIDDLEFTDDYMFGAVLHDEELCKGVIERLLKIKVAKIEYPELQKGIKTGFDSHGIRLDVYVADSDSVYDIEIQNKNYDNLGKRTRFYQSMIDSDFLLKGHEYSEMKNIFILFICKDDPFDLGLSQYTFESICHEKPDFALDDKCKKVFYNSSKYAVEKDAALRAFLNFVRSNQSTDDFTDRLQKRISDIKNNEYYRTEYMKMGTWEADIRREAIKEGLEEGRQRGLLEASKEMAKKLMQEGISLEIISRCTNLNVEELNKLSE